MYSTYLLYRDPGVYQLFVSVQQALEKILEQHEFWLGEGVRRKEPDGDVDAWRLHDPAGHVQGRSVVVTVVYREKLEPVRSSCVVWRYWWYLTAGIVGGAHRSSSLSGALDS